MYPSARPAARAHLTYRLLARQLPCAQPPRPPQQEQSRQRALVLRALLVVLGLGLLVLLQHGGTSVMASYRSGAAHAAPAMARTSPPSGRAAAAAAAAASSGAPASGASPAAVPAVVPARTASNSSANKASKPVIVVLGTAGSGTRTVHQILAAAGVWMHPFTNKEFDSKLFIQRIKHTPPFGMPGRKDGMMWETRLTPAYYEPHMLSQDVRHKLTEAHRQVAAAFLADVPDDAPVWAWKEPQAIYTLPFLMQVFPNLHVIHQTRDGRDVAMANLNSTSRRTTQPYQRHYIKLIAGRDFTPEQLLTPAFSLAAGTTWGSVNANARAWLAQHGAGLQGRYSLARLEDFCDAAALPRTLRALLSNAGVPHDAAAVARAASVINATQCQTARWEAAWSSSDAALAGAMRRLDASIGGELELFGYQPASAALGGGGGGAGGRAGSSGATAGSGGGGGRLGEAVHSQLRRLGLAQPAGAATAPLVVAFVPPAAQQGVAGLLQRWLAGLRAAGPHPLGRVLLVTQGGDASHLDSVAAAAAAGGGGSSDSGTRPLLLHLPALNSTAQQQQQQQLELLHALVTSGHPVLLSELAAVWRANLPAYLAAAAAAADDDEVHAQEHAGQAGQAGQQQTQAGFDLVASAAALPLTPRELLAARGGAAGDAVLAARLQRRMAACDGEGDAGGPGVLFINATQPAVALLRAMWRQQAQAQGAAPQQGPQQAAVPPREQQRARRQLLQQQQKAKKQQGGQARAGGGNKRAAKRGKPRVPPSSAVGPTIRVWRQWPPPRSLLGVLREQLLMANLAFSSVRLAGAGGSGPGAGTADPSGSSGSSSTTSSAAMRADDGDGDLALVGLQATTAPSTLRALFLLEAAVQYGCGPQPRSRPGHMVVAGPLHCGGSSSSSSSSNKREAGRGSQQARGAVAAAAEQRTPAKQRVKPSL